MKKSNKIKVIAFCAFILGGVLLTLSLIPIAQKVITPEGRESLEKFVSSFGIFSWLLFLGIQILQVVVAFLPGEPVEIMGGVLFGTFGGLFLCLIGILIGTMLIYYLVKSVGTPLVYAFVSKEKIDNLKILKDEKRLDIILFVLFLIPGTPKDVLTYFVPLSKIKPWKFFVIATLARIPSIVASTLVGDTLGHGNWTMTIIIFIATLTIGLVGIYFNDKIMSHIKKKH